MIGKEKLDRINQLARKAKEEGLTEAETKERDLLRKEYLANFRENFRGHLKRVKFVEDLTEDELAEYQKEKNN